MATRSSRDKQIKAHITQAFFFSFLAGVLAGVISLISWNMLGSQVYSLSLLSPNGPEVYLLGFRVKHWLIGLAFMILGGILSTTRNRMLGGFLMGFGLVLFLDELLTGDLYYWSVKTW